MIQYAHLSQFGYLQVEGEEARSFLQGYITCNMDKISGSRSQLGAICNIKGRMLTSFRILATDNGFLLRMHRELVPLTIGFLQKYIVFSKASLKDISDVCHCYGILSDVPIDQGSNQAIDQAQFKGYLTNTTHESRSEIWQESPLSAPETWEQVSQDTWNLAEISDSVAWVTGLTSESFIPQMLNYQNLGGVDFEKGCYLGQEIVTRMQFRGELKRHLYLAKVKMEAKQLPSPGDEILNQDGKNTGQLVSCAQIRNEDKKEIALLAVLKDDQAGYQLCSGESLSIVA